MKPRSRSFWRSVFAARCRNRSRAPNWLMRSSARSKRRTRTSRRSLEAQRATARLALPESFELRDERLRAAGLVAERAEWFATAIEHDHGREPLDAVLHQEPFILRSCFRRHFFRARKVQLQQHQILVRVLLEFRLRKNFLVQHDAPAAPIRAG